MLKTHRARLLSAVAILCLEMALTGCQTAGPASIQRGRPDYNNAIQETTAQMVLANIVRVHDGEMPLVMDVTQVNAAVQVQGSLSPSVAGIGGLSALQGAGPAVTTGITTTGTTGALSSKMAGTRTEGVGMALQYQESPTITYAPLSGQPLISQISQPIPVSVITSLIESQWSVPALLSLTVNYITPNTKDHYAISNALFELNSYGAVAFGSISKEKTGLNLSNVTPSIGNSTEGPENKFVIFFEPFHAEDLDTSDPRDDTPEAQYELHRRLANLWVRVILLYAPTVKFDSPFTPDKLRSLIDEIQKCEGKDDLAHMDTGCIEPDLEQLPRAIYLNTDAKQEGLSSGDESPEWNTNAPIMRTFSALGMLKAATEEPPVGQVAFVSPEQFSAIMTRLGSDEASDNACPKPAAVSPGSEFLELSNRLEWEDPVYTADQKSAGGGGLNASNTENTRLLDKGHEISALNEERKVFRDRRFLLIIKSKKPLTEYLPGECIYVSYHKDEYWYSISDRDTITKRNFALIAELMSVTAVASQTSPPSTTVLVGGR